MFIAARPASGLGLSMRCVCARHYGLCDKVSSGDRRKARFSSSDKLKAAGDAKRNPSSSTVREVAWGGAWINPYPPLYSATGGVQVLRGVGTRVWLVTV